MEGSTVHKLRSNKNITKSLPSSRSICQNFRHCNFFLQLIPLTAVLPARVANHNHFCPIFGTPLSFFSDSVVYGRRQYELICFFIVTHPVHQKTQKTLFLILFACKWRIRYSTWNYHRLQRCRLLFRIHDLFYIRNNKIDSKSVRDGEWNCKWSLVWAALQKFKMFVKGHDCSRKRKRERK